MLANLLAVIVAVGSSGIYLAAFFFPEVHRKADFLWSGVGLFYALVLWFCAPQMSASVLLGQTAAVSLLLWFGWQTLLMRRLLTPLAQQTPISFQKNNVRNRLRLENGVPFKRRSTLEYEFVEDASRPVFGPQTLESLRETEVDFPQQLDDPTLPTAETTSEARGLGIEPQVEDAQESDTLVADTPITAVQEISRRSSPPPTPGLWTKVLVIGTWLQEVIASWKRPKPPSPMFELPPRPPSIAIAKPPPSPSSSPTQSPDPQDSDPQEPNHQTTTPIQEPTPNTQNRTEPPPTPIEEESNWLDDDF